ncbi:MAG: hypothetical protein J7K94_05370 [Dehalococcoidia bacterium]|nr:hypothetical protein [Dehalococcoidia bacterium]
MGKKSRRKSKYRPGIGVAARRPPPETAGAVSAAVTAPPPKVTSSGSRQPVAARDYSYIRPDLKFTGILAGSLIVVVIILSFILG